MSSLSVLIGQELVGIEEVHDYHQLHFTRHLLNVFNSIAIEPHGGPDNVRRVVTAVDEAEDEIRIRFTDETSITIDLRGPAWTGPEAAALYLGNDCISVWT